VYRHLAIAAALLVAAAPTPAQPVRFGLDVELERDDNVTRGVLDADRKSDTIASAGVGAAKALLLGPRSGMVLRADARYSHFADFDDLSNVALSAGAAYRVQPVVGFSAPWIELSGDLQWLRHADSDLRDGSIVSLAASVGSYVTDRIRLSGGAGAQRRSGDGTGLYDLSTTRLFGSLDYRVGARTTVYGRVARVDGDHVFAAIDPVSQGWLSAIQEVLVGDAALGSGFVGYRVEASTVLFDIGVNVPFGTRTQALDFSLTRFDSKTDRDSREYDGTQLRVAYLYRFQ
jgi:hypothetical protein